MSESVPPWVWGPWYRRSPLVCRSPSSTCVDTPRERETHTQNQKGKILNRCIGVFVCVCVCVCHPWISACACLCVHTLFSSLWQVCRVTSPGIPLTASPSWSVSGSGALDEWESVLSMGLLLYISCKCLYTDIRICMQIRISTYMNANTHLDVYACKYVLCKYLYTDIRIHKWQKLTWHSRRLQAWRREATSAGPSRRRLVSWCAKAREIKNARESARVRAREGVDFVTQI